MFNTKEIRSGFKQKAVCLTAEPGRAVIEVADNRAINKDLLYRWQRVPHKVQWKHAFPGHGLDALTEEQENCDCYFPLDMARKADFLDL